MEYLQYVLILLYSLHHVSEELWCLVLLIFPIASNLAEQGIPGSAQYYSYGHHWFVKPQD